jgi:predicted enzyme related to lactoylglutathione lyase
MKNIKTIKAIFWVTTTLIFLLEGVAPALTSQSDLAIQGITSLGYPVYFSALLAVFKVLGALVLIIPTVPAKIKEWAYAGFGIDFISAFVSIWVVTGFGPMLILPVIAMFILVLSYISWKKMSACVYNAVGWFEIPVADMDRAKNFYEEILNISLNREDIPEYQMTWFPMLDGGGASGALMKGPGYDVGSQGPVIYFTCSDIDEALEKAASAGGKIILPRKSIGKYGYIGWLSDSEGNTVALHSRY